jgi:hypothetical protein
MIRTPVITAIYILILLLASTPTKAQFYSAGQDPGSLRWLQINTDNFQVIFPKGYEEQGKYIADLLEWSYEHTTTNMNHKPRKISVIVHNQTVNANGFVSWAPRRAELYATPPSDNDHHDWMERLVIHEFRHIIQVDKLNQGLTRLMGLLFGEMGTGIVVGHIPLWFLEGDAVVTETEFTRGGRGRLPRFEQGLRAQLLTLGPYSFDKAIMGSYKHYVPNHYEIGYQLVASTRAQYGQNIWSSVLDNVARRPWGLSPFSSEFKRQTGFSTKRYYQRTMAMLDSAWTNQLNNQSYSDATIINHPSKFYTNYQYPQWINDSTVVALKRGLRDIAAMVSVGADGKEKILFNTGSVMPNSVHYAQGKLVWAEYRPDPRWEHRSFSEIMIYDFYTNIRKQITRKAKYFSPALSPVEALIVVTEISPENVNSVVIIDAVTGKETWRYSYPGNDLILQPTWHSEGKKIAVIALSNTEKRIDEITIVNKQPTTLLKAEDADISSPQYYGDDILFNGTWSGVDNIYILKPGAEPIMAVSSEFGAVNANALNGKIVYSDYSAQGYNLKTIKISEFENTPLSSVEDQSLALHKRYINPEGPVIGPKNVARGNHQIKPYSKAANLLYLHSWFPAFLDVDNIDIDPGASILFQNKLSTSFAQLGYAWDLNDQTGKYSATYSYKGWYPVMDLIAETGDRKGYYTSVNDEIKSFGFKENNYSLALSVPLRYQSFEYFFGLTPSAKLGINQITENRNTPGSILLSDNRTYTFKGTDFYSQQFRIFGYRQRRSVPRDIFPRDGQVIDIQYRHTPWGGADMGTLFAARGILYIPGLIRHHGIRLSAGYQNRQTGENTNEPGTVSVFYSFGGVIPYPRGIIGKSHQNLKVFTAEYAFPIMYPDLSISQLIYVKRLKSYVFYDYALGRRFPAPNQSKGRLEAFESYGLGITADVHIFRLFAPISLGGQVAFTGEKTPVFRFIYNISI